MSIQEILTKLHEQMSDAQIGEQIGAAQSIVTRLRTGKHKRTYYDRHKAIENLARSRGVIK